MNFRRTCKPELLSPGGSLDKVRIAFLYGADAVYVSGKDFGLRGFAHNLDSEEMAAATLTAHRLGKKIYAAVNIFARRPDLEKIPPYLEFLQELGVDALIVSDPGVILLARRYAPETPIHLSTQANTTNLLSVEFWREQGMRRINLARELNFEEIAEISEKSRVELEVFVHGAMCMSYSGRCLMSAFLNPPPSTGPDVRGGNATRGRSANSGFCTQPCRWSWGLTEEKRPGEVFTAEQDARGTYIFNSKDLCLLEEIGALAGLGIDSFKIEGRMKGLLYVSSVTRAYRQAVDRCSETGLAYAAEPDWIDDLQKVSHRPYTKGSLFDGAPGKKADVETRVSYIQTHTLAGLVHRCLDREFQPLVPATDGEVFLQVRSRLIPGQRLEFLCPDGSSNFHLLDSFEDINGNRLSYANPNSWIRFSVDFPVFPYQTVRVPSKNGA